MATNVMSNVKEKLSQSRELCEGMSERAYLFADYMSEIIPDTLTPLELAEYLARAVADIGEEQRWRKIAKKGQLRYQLSFIPKKIQNQAVNFPQIIDTIAVTDFAEEFRAICKEKFDINPPKRGTTHFRDYPEYVKVAVNWWTNAISLLKTNAPYSPAPDFLLQAIPEEAVLKSYSDEDLLVFQETLANEIMEDVMAWGCCILSVEYQPCNALATAGDKIDISKVFGYPLLTSMTIWKSKVRVRVGYGTKSTTIWTSTK